MKIVLGDPEKGINKAKELFYKYSGDKTVIFLSGGSTPKPLYSLLAREKKLKVGAIAMVDDRYSMHEQYSNEFLIRDSGLVQYVEKRGGAFFSILEYGLSLPKTAKKYDETLDFLFDKFSKRIAVLGIGSDGHTASLPVQVKSQKLKVKSLQFVSYVRTFPMEPKVPRISLNKNALSLMDLLIVLAFGEDKKEGIKKALNSFFKGFTKRTILITDQKL